MAPNDILIYSQINASYHQRDNPAADGNRYGELQPDNLEKERQNLEHSAINRMHPLNPSLLSLADTMEEEAKQEKESEGMKVTKKTRPSKST